MPYRDSFQLVMCPSCEMSFWPVSISYSPSSVPFAVACQCSNNITSHITAQVPHHSVVNHINWHCTVCTLVLLHPFHGSGVGVPCRPGFDPESESLTWRRLRALSVSLGLLWNFAVYLTFVQ